MSSVTTTKRKRPRHDLTSNDLH